MFPEFPDLQELGLDDHEMLAAALSRHPAPMCDLSPANLFIWHDCEKPWATRVGDSVCILLEGHREPPYFLEPIGGSSKIGAVRPCLSRTGRLSRVSKALADALPSGEFDVQPLRDHFDYVYRREALAELKGKKYDGKRNQIRKFAAGNPGYEFRPLEPSRYGEAAALFERWHQRRGNGDVSPEVPHDCQRRALERAFREFARLDLTGGELVSRGRMVGFVIASTGLADSAVVHFQYADSELPGVYQTLLWESCRRILAACTFVNLEEDLGLAGLRKTKLSYQPLRLEEKYEVRLRQSSP